MSIQTQSSSCPSERLEELDTFCKEGLKFEWIDPKVDKNHGQFRTDKVGLITTALIFKPSSLTDAWAYGGLLSQVISAMTLR